MWHPHLTRRERADVRTCDADCRLANNCNGHRTCRECGRPYCPWTEGFDGRCGTCMDDDVEYGGE